MIQLLAAHEQHETAEQRVRTAHKKQQKAEQHEAEQHEAEQHETDQHEVEQHEAEQREAEQREAEQREEEHREAEAEPVLRSRSIFVRLQLRLQLVKNSGSGSGSSLDNLPHKIKKNPTIFMVFKKISCFLKTLMIIKRFFYVNSNETVIFKVNFKL
jgi:hypothetical protein